MMRRPARVRDVAAGTAAVLAVLVVLVGVPVALLVGIGWPLPSEVPSLDAVTTALRYGRIAPSTLLRSLAVVLWIIWALTVLSIALEAAAVARGTVARALPGLGGLQATAARLVATVMLLSSLTVRATAAEPGMSLPPPLASAPVEVTGAHDPADTRTEQRPQPPATRTRFWEVRRRDSLWTIAERSLGDGSRWKEIAALNHGRAQPDGGQLRPGDTLIRPGWRLALPPDADQDARPVQVTVERGDDLWSLSVEHLDDGARWPEIYARNRGRPQSDGQRLTDPDLIRPGWVLRLPADDPGSDDGEAGAGPPRGDRSPAAASADGAAEATPGPGSPASDPSRPNDDPTAPEDGSGGNEAADGSGSATAPDVRPPAGQSDDGAAPSGVMPPPVTPSTLRPHTPPSPSATTPTAEASVTPLTATARRRTSSPSRGIDVAVLGGAAVLAAGLVGLLARRRRHWLQRRAAGTALGPVEPETEEFERWLRSMADHHLHERLDRVLRVLTDHFAEHDVAPTVTAVELGEQVTLRLAQPNSGPPPGVTSNEEGTRWVLAPELEMAPTAPQRFLPALVSCGRLAAGQLLLLNLLEAGLLSVVGTTAETAAALTSWTAELAAGGAAGGVEVVIVGPHHALVERLPRVTVVDSAGEALERVRRVVDDADGFATRIVVIGGAPPDPEFDPLITAAEDPRVAVIVPGEHAAGTCLEISGEHVRLAPDGAWFDAPEWLSPQDWDRFGDLLRQPDRDTHAAPVGSPLLAVDALDPAAPAGELASEPDDPGSIVVGLLGPLTVDGRSASVDAGSAPLLTYLAAHPTGGDPAALAATLWPAAPDRADRLDRAVAAIAGALDGRLGPSPLVVTDDGRLELPAAVTTDLRILRDLLRQLDLRPSAEQARRLYTALELVRGEPFPTGAEWAHADGTATRTIGLITDTAHRLAMQSLAVGDLERADWAAAAGLRAAPTCELLYRDRMRIADARGDRATIDVCMRELRARVEADAGWVTPETTALYSQLRHEAHGPDTGDRRQDAS